MEAAECGAASLAMILAYHGRWVPLPDLRRECGVSRDGSKASNVVKVAKTYGLKAKGFKKSLEALQDLSPPFIVFWNFNHFLVVEGIGPDWVYLNDPACGPRRVSLAAFDEGYTGVVLAFEPGAGFRKEGRRPSVVVALRKRLAGHGAPLLFSILAGFLLVFPGLAIPVFTQVFVDKVLVQGFHDWLRPLLLGLLLTTVLQAVLVRLRLVYLRRFKLKLAMGMSAGFLGHLLRLPAGFYAQRYAGEVAGRLHVNDGVAGLLSGRLATTAIDAVMIVFYAGVMLQYDAMLTGIGVGFAAVNLLVLQWLSRRRVDASTAMIQAAGKVHGIGIAGLQAIESLKASASESDFFTRWAGHSANAVSTHQRFSSQDQVLHLLPAFLDTLAGAVLLVLGGLRVIEGHLSVGMLVAFQHLMHSFLAPVHSLVHLGGDLQVLRGELNRLDDILDNEPERPGLAAGEPTRTDFRLSGALELRDVAFGYSPIEPPLIEGFSLTVRPGERVALVGGSGSGKSTVAKLLTGLYQPWSGEIHFDGRPREAWPRPVLTNSIALMDQDIVLFGGSVRDNLTLWDETVPDDVLVAACKDAAVHDVILGLPGGYDAKLDEGGANLSGGQRQRLDIARALVGNPRLLVMDEATSALDAETERLIDQNLRRRGCTCVLVAHRLSTFRDCDEILVLEQGKIVQRGTHAAMIAVDGPYRRLVLSEQDEAAEAMAGAG
jgi:ATP-binding cassette subfamily C protein